MQVYEVGVAQYENGPKSDKEVPSLMDVLDRNISSTYKLAQEFEKRLEPILHSSDKKAITADAIATDPTMCQMGRHVRDQIDQLSAITALIHSMMDRLEI